MRYFVYRAATGRILWSVTAPAAPDLSFDETLAAIEVADSLPDTPGAFMVQDGEIVDRVPSFEDNRRAKLGSAATHYGALLAAGFTWNGVLYQTDAASQSNLTAMGAMAMGSAMDAEGSPWPEDFYWIAANNAHVPMDAADTYALARAVGTYVSGCILRYRAIKDAIAAAEDQTVLDAVDVTAGYPDADGAGP